MRGMDNGPWTGLGRLGWFLGVWVVMMAAMMFPSVAPTVALYSRMTRQRSRWRRCCSRPAISSRGQRAGCSHSRVARATRRLAGDVLGGIRRSLDRRRDARGRGRVRADAVEGSMPAASAGARSASCWARGATAARGAVRMGARTARGAWAAAGPDGGAVRARRDEHRLDGVRRRP